MRVEGIEPSTSVLSGQRSTTELHSRVYPSHQYSKIKFLDKKMYGANQIFVTRKTSSSVV